MALSVPEFWKLVIESQLLDAEQCQQLGSRWGHVKGAAELQQAKTLAEWLVSQNVLSRYQAKILLAGRPGPFVYGAYCVYDRIAQGPLTGVFQAVHAATRHPVWLHFITSSAVHEPRVWGSICQQLMTRCAARNPYLLKYFAAVDAGSYKFLVSEEISGRTMGDHLGTNGPLPVAEAARVARSVAIALGTLHDHGQVHGNLTPDAVWIDNTGTVKVVHSPAYFPIPASFQTTTEAATSSADYWAPELGHGHFVTDALTDIYALGCTLYFLLSGQPPFPGGTLAEKLTRHANEAIQPLEPAGVPQALARLVAFCMAKNRAVRIAHWGVVANQLQPFIDSRVEVPGGPTPVPPTLAPYERALQADSAPISTANLPVASPAIAPTLATPAEVPNPISHPTSVALQSAPTVEVSPGTPASRNRAATEKLRHYSRPRRRTQPMILASVGVALLAIFAVLYGIHMAGSKPKDSSTDLSAGAGETTLIDTRAKPATPHVPNAGGVNARKPETRPEDALLPDDGVSLWASPTSGPPINLQHVPHGGQFYLHFRPARIVHSETGPAMLKSLGPQFERQLSEWEQAAGVSLKEIDHLIGVLYANDTAFPRVAWVVRLVEAIDEDQLLARWHQPQAALDGDHAYFQGPDWSYIVPADTEGKLFIMTAAASELREALQARGVPPVLRSDLQKLLLESDSDRHCTVFGAPNFLFSELFAEGRTFYFGSAQRVREALEWLLGDDLQALSCSLHLESDFYWEMRLAANPNVDRFRLATNLRNRLEEVPDHLFNFVVQLTSNPYWEKVRFQLPQMIRYAHKMSRVSVDGDTALLNGVLPDYAAHNLAFGAELLIASSPGVAVTVPIKTPSPFKSVDEVLAKFRTKIAFDANTLEFAMQDIAKDVNDNIRGLPFEFKIKIMGDHLLLDGITRNQTVRNFSQSDKTVAEILTALAFKANPITTVQDPSEPDQKLIWVVAENPDQPGQQVVLITTRQMAEKKRYQLPMSFRPKQ